MPKTAVYLNGRVPDLTATPHPVVTLSLDNIPPVLRARPQWVCWKYLKRDGKLTKCPFNPRDGSAQEIGLFENKGAREFAPPNDGEMVDWVLVLDDAAKMFPAPGHQKGR